MLLTTAWEWCVAFKGPTHPLAVAFSESIKWFNLMEDDSVYTFFDAVHGAYLAAVGEDDETVLELMGDLTSIMDGLTITYHSQKYSPSSRLERFLRKLEAGSHIERCLVSVCYLVQFVEQDVTKHVLQYSTVNNGGRSYFNMQALKCNLPTHIGTLAICSAVSASAVTSLRAWRAIGRTPSFVHRSGIRNVASQHLGMPLRDAI